MWCLQYGLYFIVYLFLQLALKSVFKNLCWTDNQKKLHLGSVEKKRFDWLSMYGTCVREGNGDTHVTYCPPIKKNDPGELDSSYWCLITRYRKDRELRMILKQDCLDGWLLSLNNRKLLHLYSSWCFPVCVLVVVTKMKPKLVLRGYFKCLWGNDSYSLLPRDDPHLHEAARVKIHRLYQGYKLISFASPTGAWVPTATYPPSGRLFNGF